MSKLPLMKIKCHNCGRKCKVTYKSNTGPNCSDCVKRFYLAKHDSPTDVMQHLIDEINRLSVRVVGLTKELRDLGCGIYPTD